MLPSAGPCELSNALVFSWFVGHWYTRTQLYINYLYRCTCVGCVGFEFPSHNRFLLGSLNFIILLRTLRISRLGTFLF